MPCHHIPLNASGATIDELEFEGNQPEMEEAVRSWLRETINKLEVQKPA